MVSKERRIYNQRVNRAVARAMDGNESEANWLIKQSRKYATKANKRLRELGELEYSHKGAAYNFSTRFLESINLERFSSSIRKLGSYEELGESLKIMYKFINSSTSTVEGVIRQRQKSLDYFREAGIKISPEQEDSFIDFINSEEWTTLKQNVSSDVLIHDIKELQNIRGNNLNKVLDAYSKWARDTSGRTYDLLQEELGFKYE